MISSIKPAALSGWQLAALGAVAALAVGAGVVVGSFLLSSRVALGAAAEYVPAGTPFYIEVRVEPSAEQDSALREFLGHFPAVEGLDLDRPIAEQMAEHLDEMLATEGAELSWAADVEPWFDGRLAIAITDVAVDMADPTATPPVVAFLGVTDRDEAAAAVERVTTSSGMPSFAETTHAGVTVHVGSGGEPGAFALTDDQLIIGTAETAVTAAIDAHGNRSETLAARSDLSELTDSLPADWLAFATWDMRGLVTEAFEAASEADPQATAAIEALFEHQSLRGAAAISASGDRIAIDTAAEAPTGPFAVENGDRGLAEEVPAGALYYSEAVDLGEAIGGIIGPIKEAAAEDPAVEEQIRMAEAALGGDLEELLAWIGDAALVAGVIDDGPPYAGLVIAPDDMDDAERRVGQLTSFAGLAALDPSIGLSVSEAEIEGTTVTTIRWDGAAGMGVPELPVEAGELVVQLALTDDRVLIGVGEAFIDTALGLEESASLASDARFSGAVAELGGASNAGVTWVDVAGVVDLAGGLIGSMMPMAGEDDPLAWLDPIDALVVVNRIEGDLLVSRGALLVE